MVRAVSTRRQPWLTAVPISEGWFVPGSSSQRSLSEDGGVKSPPTSGRRPFRVLGYFVRDRLAEACAPQIAGLPLVPCD